MQSENATQARPSEGLVKRIGTEAGLDVYDTFPSGYDIDCAQLTVAMRFAQLVAEECAKACVELDCAHRCGVGHEFAAAIRAKFGVEP